MPLFKSWVESANSENSPFPLNNLPYGVFSVDGDRPRCGVAIGDMILDLAAVEKDGLVSLGHDAVFDRPSWNAFMSLGYRAWDDLRARLTELLSENALEKEKVQPHLVPQSRATMHLPIEVTEFTDFYASRYHASNVGTMYRGAANALPPNWLHLPIGYNGRASSVVVSGTDIRRPWGQIKKPDASAPEFMPCQKLDFELELGAIVGQPSEGLISTETADQMIFGYVLLNDWSARDIQAWEYQPLGPFQAKALGTTISPWIVTSAALEPFRVNTPPREFPLLPYLKESKPSLYDIELDVYLTQPAGARSRIARTNCREMYYSSAQQIAHHTVSGCPMRVGDLIGSGTISGPEKSSRGSLLEISWNGSEPLDLPEGPRSFLEDGDTVTFVGCARGDGYIIGFGECVGRILPAHASPVGAGR